METIKYTIGDATKPVGDGNKVIVHICNDIGGWGRGFVVAISKRWKTPETEYRRWFSSRVKFELGEVQFVKVEENLWVGNMIAQKDVKPDAVGKPPLRYEALRSCLSKVCNFANTFSCSVHMPRIGSGLACGSWGDIEPIIIDELVSKGVKTTVYDLE